MSLRPAPPRSIDVRKGDACTCPVCKFENPFTVESVPMYKSYDGNKRMVQPGYVDCQKCGVQLRVAQASYCSRVYEVMESI